MSVQILDALARDGFEELIALSDPSCGLRAFIALHDTSGGPAIGGIRRWAYKDESSALADCLRLARVMTAKCVLADLPAGGAKTVLLETSDLEPEAAYRAIGRRVEQLGGRYYAGPDLGTGERETGWLAAETRYAADPGPAGPGQLAQATAAGVFAGMRVALETLDGAADWAGRTVVVQGLGQVGMELARRLREQDARVCASDLDHERCARAERELGIETVKPGDEYSIPCDVFSPNAMSGVLHDLTLVKLKARAIVGAANNSLASLSHGDRLHEDGTLYVPDFVVSSGALVRGTLFHLEGRREPLEAIETRIAAATAAVLVRAALEDRPPARVALREVEERLARRRSSRTAAEPIDELDPEPSVPSDRHRVNARGVLNED